MDISVIIPVYNTQPYLHECIESVIASECFPRCEVLLVNDGSTDSSEEILRAYAEKYENIRCLKYGCPPWNRGLSAARNLGVEHANGEYLFFLDSDDAIQPGYLEALHKEAQKQKCEIVYAGFSRWNDGIQPITRQVLECCTAISGREFVNRRMDMRDDHNYVWCALYRTSLFREKGLCFDSSVRLYEDILFFWRAASKAERVSAVPEYGYLYRVRSGSLVQDGVQRRDADGILNIIEILAAEASEKPLDRYLFMVISMYLYYLGVLTEKNQITAEEQRNYYQKLSGLSLLPQLRRSAVTRNEKLKWLIWKINWRLFYPLVKK